MFYICPILWRPGDCRIIKYTESSPHTTYGHSLALVGWVTVLSMSRNKYRRIGSHKKWTKESLSVRCLRQMEICTNNCGREKDWTEDRMKPTDRDGHKSRFNEGRITNDVQHYRSTNTRAFNSPFLVLLFAGDKHIQIQLLIPRHPSSHTWLPVHSVTDSHSLLHLPLNKYKGQ